MKKMRAESLSGAASSLTSESFQSDALPLDSDHSGICLFLKLTSAQVLVQLLGTFTSAANQSDYCSQVRSFSKRGFRDLVCLHRLRIQPSECSTCSYKSSRAADFCSLRNQ